MRALHPNTFVTRAVHQTQVLNESSSPAIIVAVVMRAFRQTMVVMRAARVTIVINNKSTSSKNDLKNSA
jgi:hypothetical protein